MIMNVIREAHSSCEGWCSWMKAEAMASLVIGMKHELSVEIGVFGGKSLLPVALAHQHNSFGRVIAIDPWMADASVEGQVNEADVKWWSNQQMHDGVLAGFKDKIRRYNLEGIVDVRRVKSNDMEPPSGIGLLSIDGNHGIQVLTDVERYATNVNRGGYVVMDDIFWSGGAVQQAIEHLVKLGFRELYRRREENDWAIFQRI